MAQGFTTLRTNITAINGTTPSVNAGTADAGTLRVVHVNDVGVSTNATQAGTWNIATVTTLTGVTNSIAANVVDSGGVPYTTTNPFPVGDAGGSLTIDGTVAVSGITNSVAANVVDSGGVPYTTTNPFPVGDAGGSLTIDGTVAVSGITASVAASLIDSSGVGYSGSNPLPVVFSGSSSTSVSLVNADGTYYDSANPLPVSLASTGTTIVQQLSGATDSVNVVQFNGNTPATGLNETTVGVLRVVQMTDSVASTVVNSGTLTSITDTITQQQLSGAVDSVVVNSGTITTVTTLTGVTNTVNVMLDSADGVYTSANPFPVTLVSGALTSTIAVGDVASDAADVGSAPIKVGGIARTANPTAVAAGDRVSATYDDLGRQVMRVHQVRDLISTAFATLSTNTETTLLAGAASTFRDLLWVKFANTSTGAVTIDLRETTAGTVIDTYEIPGNATQGISMAMPYPQANSAGTWTVDYNDADLSGTTVYVSALFTNEV